MNVLKKILLFFLLLKLCTCNAQKDDFPVCFQDMNIPFVSYSGAISIGKKILENKLIKTSGSDSSISHRIVIRIAEESELYRMPFKHYTHETIAYWDTTLVQEPKNLYSLIGYLYDSALNNTVKCYSFDGMRQYKEKELIALLQVRDSISIIDVPQKNVHYNEISIDDVEEAVIIEEWQQTSTGVKSKILAIAPIVTRSDENGNYAGIVLMCWFIMQ